MKFVQEKILDSCKVYRRIHKNYLNKKGDVRPNAFMDSYNDPTKGMSVDWAKYTNAKKSVMSSPKPEIWAKVAVLNVKDIREIIPLKVEHTPSWNQAHSTVWGEKTTEIRLKLFKAAKNQILSPPF